MAKVGEIFEFLNKIAPVDRAAEYDNVGLLVGRGEADVSRVVVALDVLPETILEAEGLGAQLIVSHHPVIFQPAQSLTDGDTTGLRALMLAERGIAAICMHTNLDVALVNDVLAETIGLGDVQLLPESDGVCRYGRVEPMELDGFAELVRDRLGANGLRYCDSGRPVERVAVGGGACGDYVASAVEAGCDTLVVGEVKYHQWLEARMLGLNLVDAGHFPTEDVVCGRLVELLKSEFQALEVTKSTTQDDFIRWK